MLGVSKNYLRMGLASLLTYYTAELVRRLGF
jgi:hypothetical protein